MIRPLMLAGTCALLAACGPAQPIPANSQFGAHPNVPEPSTPLLTQTNIPDVVGWQGDAAPTVAKGFAIAPFATGLSSPRNMLVLDNGDVLVVDSKKTAPEPLERPKDFIMGLLFAQAHGGKEAPSNQVILLRDSDGDGKADQRKVLIDKLNSPFGIAYANGQLYVAATDAVLSYGFKPGDDRIAAPPRKIADLPAGPINHHWTKSLTLSPDGSKLYAGVGSNSNILERGVEAETNRAAVWEIDIKSGAERLFASGLRNPNGLTFYPGSNTLWAVINERDELGPNLVPDYMTSVKDGAFYGWPYSSYGQHIDQRAQPQRPDLVRRATPADYALGSHVAPLGLAFYTGNSFPAAFRGGAFVAEHGSWNSDGLHGYHIVFIQFRGGMPVGNPHNFVAGFIKDGKAQGRPVGDAIDKSVALLIADDAGNTVWRVTYSGSPPAA